MKRSCLISVTSVHGMPVLYFLKLLLKFDVCFFFFCRMNKKQILNIFILILLNNAFVFYSLSLGLIVRDHEYFFF